VVIKRFIPFSLTVENEASPALEPNDGKPG
jgi:hypothetical protein